MGVWGLGVWGLGLGGLGFRVPCFLPIRFFVFKKFPTIRFEEVSDYSALGKEPKLYYWEPRLYGLRVAGLSCD